VDAGAILGWGWPLISTYGIE